MPAFWLAVTAVIAPIKSGPMNDVTFPVSANRPKYCAMRSFGARRIKSVRDDEVIKAADDHGIAMVFTGTRHFRH